MYCPLCATQNTDDTKYCRSCGANVALVPQALTGRLPEDRSRKRHRQGRDEERPSLENGITKAFMGVGFLLVSAGVFFFAPAGRIWWFWMLIPAFALLGKGIAEIVTCWKPQTLPPVSRASMPPRGLTAEFPPHNDVLIPPPSVTEQTTRQLDPTTDPYRIRDKDAR